MTLETIWAALCGVLEPFTSMGFGWSLALLVVSTAFAGATVYGVFLLCRSIRAVFRRNGALRSAVLSVVSLGILAAVAISGLHFLRGPYFISHSDRLAQAEPQQVDRGALLVLQDEAGWSALDEESRLEVLQVLLDAERSALGISKPVALRAEPLEGALGDYNNKRSMVRIDTNHLMTSPPRDVVRTICHETYHCYEYCLAEVFARAGRENRNLLPLRAAASYHADITDGRYIDAETDYAAYMAQPLENDAYYYASVAMERYFPQGAEG